MSELLHCDHCGELRSILVDDGAGDADGWSVICSMRDGGCGARSGYRPTRREAIAAWNRRTPPAAAPVEPRPGEAGIEIERLMRAAGQSRENATAELDGTLNQQVWLEAEMLFTRAADLIETLTARPGEAQGVERELLKACAAELAEFFYPANPPYRSKEAMAQDMTLVLARHFQAALASVPAAPVPVAVERVARAIWMASRPINPGGMLNWDAMLDEYKEQWRVYARAALAAQQPHGEPT